MWKAGQYETRKASGLASGSGTRNIFSYDDLIVTETLKVMIDTGVPRKFAGELARWLQNNQFYQKAFRSIASKPLAYFEIYVKPDGTMETAITQKETAFVINRKKHKPVIVYSINLNHIINKVELAVNGK